MKNNSKIKLKDIVLVSLIGILTVAFIVFLVGTQFFPDTFRASVASLVDDEYNDVAPLEDPDSRTPEEVEAFQKYQENQAKIKAESEAKEIEDLEKVIAQVPDVQCLIRHEYRPYVEYGLEKVDDIAFVEVYSLQKQFRVKFISHRNSTRMNEDDIQLMGNIYPPAAKALKRYAQQCLQEEKEQEAEAKRQNPPVSLY